jgi:hypothetical protein
MSLVYLRPMDTYCWTRDDIWIRGFWNFWAPPPPELESRPVCFVVLGTTLNGNEAIIAGHLQAATAFFTAIIGSLES